MSQPQNVSVEVFDLSDYLTSSFPAFVIILIFGVTSVISNFLIITTLFSSRVKHGNFRFNACHLAMAELIMGICLLILSINRISGYIEDTITCRLLQTLMISAVAALNCQSFCLAFDRFLSTLFPHWYYQLCRDTRKSKYLRQLNMSVWLISLTSGILFASMGLKVEIQPVCSSSLIFQEEFYNLSLVFYSVFTLATTLCYISILFHNFQRQVCYELTPQARDNLVICKTVGIIVSCHFVTWVTALSISIVIANCCANLLPVVHSYLIALGLLNGSITLPIYICFIRQMRRDFLALFSNIECCFIETHAELSL